MKHIFPTLFLPALRPISTGFLLLALCCLPLAQWAQKPVKPSASDLQQAIKKLNVLGSVLYVAAHPDDENQRLISYCANEKLYTVNYLSLTRGDGGQNLVGPELRELLGVLRTEELLMARSVDGGRQRFSRANDFGFSKTPEETLQLWNRDEVLSDVVWTIRETQPDVIINRFYHDKKYDTHGHHTSSAILSVDAFVLAGKSDVYPEQLSFTKPWQPKRQFFNTSWWFYGGREAFEKMDKSQLFSLDLGVYLPLKGKSNNEIAAEARSMHRCQGFGSLSTRGESTDYFEFIQGDRPTTNDVFAGINTTWSRVPGGETIGVLLARVEQNFRPDNPGASLPDLLNAMEGIQKLPDGYWRRVKLEEIKDVIRGCMGLYLEATAAEPTATPGDAVKLRLECIFRNAPPAGEVTLTGVSVLPGVFDTLPAKVLPRNFDWVLNKTVTIPANTPFTSPYWLNDRSTLGMYTVKDQRLRGVPETPRDIKVRWSLSVNGTPVEFVTDVAYKTEEPAIGEIWRPFDVLPPVFVEFVEPSYLFTERAHTVQVRVKAGRANVSGAVSVLGPGNGWVSSGGKQPFEFKYKGEEKIFSFTVEGNYLPSEATLTAAAQVGDKTYTKRLVTIKYDHIPQQSILLPAEVHAARLDLQVSAKNIGYYMGAGDEGPNALRQMGCTVTLLDDSDLSAANLKKYDAVVLGIRAYNTKEALRFHQGELFEYVKNGGTLVTQYNNSFDLVVTDLAPYPLKLGRARVTDEAAEIRLLHPEHPLLNTPNKITADDFKGWVQERGLYFPTEWDAHFTPLFSSNDPGENAADGSLLVAPYGQGQLVYSSLSFFRQLPAGVPGAFRLFANLVSSKTKP
ncbi:MAG: PIG-L family deacetylase [Saprospiraceae bacterium]|nr:PIG-L family deacetylase [Saprospiraceae bacterium]